MKYKTLTPQQVMTFVTTKTPLYGCAYEIDNESLYPHRRKKPVKGILLFPNGAAASRYPLLHNILFAELKKDNQPKTSGLVHYTARMYADTYEEAVELYNETVQNRIDKLSSIIQNASNDFLPIPKQQVNPSPSEGKLRITNACPENWYENCIGEIFRIKNKTSYESIGIEVYADNGRKMPPYVVAHGDYELL